MKGLAAIIGVGVFLIVIGVGGYLFYRHSGFFVFEHNPVRWMPDMHQTLALRPQRGYNFYENGSGARVPPNGSLARTQKIYPYAKDMLAADVRPSSNPVKVTRSTVLRGQKLYNTYCIVCHGPDGNGDGNVVGPFPNPPSLHSEKVRAYADSQIFHIITRGQNLMSSYASQIREMDRWAIIHYVRALQLADNPDKEDLEAFKQVIAADGVK